MSTTTSAVPDAARAAPRARPLTPAGPAGLAIDSRLTKVYRAATPLSAREEQIECILNSRGELEVFTIGTDGHVYSIRPDADPVEVVDLGLQTGDSTARARRLAVARGADSLITVAVTLMEDGVDVEYLHYIRESTGDARWSGPWLTTPTLTGNVQGYYRREAGRITRLLLLPRASGGMSCFCSWEASSPDADGNWLAQYHVFPDLASSPASDVLRNMWTKRRTGLVMDLGRTPDRKPCLYIADPARGCLAALPLDDPGASVPLGPSGVFPVALAACDDVSGKGSAVAELGSDRQVRVLDAFGGADGEVLPLGATDVRQLAVARRPDGRLEVLVLTEKGELYHAVQESAAAAGWTQLIPIMNGVSHFAEGTNRDGYTEVFAVTSTRTAADATLVRAWQDPVTGAWALETVEVPTRGAPPEQRFAYVTGVAVTSAAGVPVYGVPVQITPVSDFMRFSAAGREYEADPQAPVLLQTDVTGKVVVEVDASGLQTVEFDVAVNPGTPDAVTRRVAANRAIQDRLYGTTKEQLAALQTHDGRKVFGPAPDDALMGDLATLFQTAASLNRPPKSQDRYWVLAGVDGGISMRPASWEEYHALYGALPRAASAGIGALLGDAVQMMTAALTGGATLPDGGTLERAIALVQEVGADGNVDKLTGMLKLVVNGMGYSIPVVFTDPQQGLALLKGVFSVLGDAAKAAGFDVPAMWDALLDALGDLLDWGKQIVPLKRVIKHFVTSLLDYAPTGVQWMGQQADGFLGDLETALSQATGGVGGLGDTGTTPLPSLPSLLGGLPFQPRSDLDWIFRSLLGSAFTLPRRPIPPEMRRRMQALEDALSQSIIPLATGLVNLMGDTLDTLSQKSISDLAAITRAAQDELQIVDALRRIEQPFFAVLADLVRYFGDSLDAEIDVPLLSEFYELVVGDQPTLLDALCLVLAAQTAAVFTVTTGRTEIEFLKDRRTMDWLLSASFADLVGAGAAHSREAAAIPPGAMAFLTLALQIVYSGCYALAIIPGVALDLADDKTGAQTRLELLAISGALSTVAIAVSCPAYFSGGTNLRSRVNRMELAYWGFQSWFLAVPMLATAEASAGKKWQQLFQILGGGCEFFGSFVSLGLAIALAVYEDQEQSSKLPIALETSQNCLGAVMQLLAPVRPVIAKKPEALAALYVLSYGGVATLNLTRALQAFSNAPHQRDA